MNKINQTKEDQLWTIIDKEKRRDKQLKMISWLSWGMTLLILLVFTYITMNGFARTLSLFNKGVIAYREVLSTLIPFLATIGSFSTIIAILVTVGRFMRLRTTNLLEVQQRLTNLEQLIRSKED